MKLIPRKEKIKSEPVSGMSGGNESAEACGIIPLTFIQTGDTQLYSAQRIRAQQSLVERQTSLWNVPLSALSASFLSDDQPL